MTWVPAPARVFILVYRGMQLGGIETLLLRISHHLVTEGMRVILVARDGPLVAGLNPRVERVLYRDALDAVQLFRGIVANSQWPGCVLLSCDPYSAALAELLMAWTCDERRPMSHITGCFHPRAYFSEFDPPYERRLNAWLAKAIGDNRYFFMGRTCRSAHEKQWRRPLQNSPTIFLPLSPKHSKWQSRGDRTLRIVSVGRITGFKAYNFGSIAIVKQLLSDGIDVEWQIYGHGEDEHQLVEAIAAAGLGRHLAFKGPSPYETFDATVLSADLFVGMGTAALEAASVGVPTIVCIDQEPDGCYGFLHQLPVGETGERLPERPIASLSSTIAAYAALPAADRRTISTLCHDHCKHFSIENFVDGITNLTTKVGRSRPNWLLASAAAAYFWAAERSRRRVDPATKPKREAQADELRSR